MRSRRRAWPVTSHADDPQSICTEHESRNPMKIKFQSFKISKSILKNLENILEKGAGAEAVEGIYVHTDAVCRGVSIAKNKWASDHKPLITEAVATLGGSYGALRRLGKSSSSFVQITPKILSLHK